MSKTFIRKKKYIKISSHKLTPWLEKIKKKSYKQVLMLLKTFPIKISRIIWLCLSSTISVAKNDFGIKKRDLIILDAYATQGPMLKRVQPHAKGKAAEIKKRYSHLTLKISNNKKRLLRSSNNQATLLKFLKTLVTSPSIKSKFY